MCPEEQFEGKQFFLKKKMKIFDLFRTLSKIFSDFWQKQFGRVVKSAIYASNGTFWHFEEKWITYQIINLTNRANLANLVNLDNLANLANLADLANLFCLANLALLLPTKSFHVMNHSLMSKWRTMFFAVF